MGTRKYIVTLTSEERERLTQLVPSGQDKAYRIKHANILLTADENGPHLTSQNIAKIFSCHLNTGTSVSDLLSKVLRMPWIAKSGNSTYPAEAGWSRRSKINRPCLS
jgi:hypothetical protein